MTPVTSVGVSLADHGVVGELSWPSDGAASFPGVLVFGGSEGGLTGSSFMARALAEEGFCALALAYFGAPGLPAELTNVPVEYLEKGVQFLATHPRVAARRVGALGISKGAEAVLLLASRDPAIAAVVAGVPSHVCWQGINRANFADPSASWTAGGKPVAFVPYDFSKPFVSVLDLYQRSLPHETGSSAEIPVERICGPIVLVAGEDDTLWPSAHMCRLMEARLAANKFPHSVETLIYPQAGHGAFGPPVPPGHPFEQLDALGGTMAGNSAARADSWTRSLEVLRSALQ